MSLRAFISVNIPSTPEIDDTLRNLAGCVRSVTWVKRENLHFTLKFLGQIEEKSVSGISAALRDVSARYVPFGISLKSVGAFPGEMRPKVVWIGMEEIRIGPEDGRIGPVGTHGSGTMAAIQAEIEDALAFLGFKKEDRPFSPHLTIGRVKNREGQNLTANKILAEKIGLSKGFNYGTFEVSSICLMRSDLLPTGPRYTVIEEFPLGLSSPLKRV
ncbi:MAG: RNA 2',3'-cyclic phosphodiesterase [Nitrospirae bacterium]|nr:RNA 2',3'-cyclic phosphodiesterase [Nitrospirota bacterium]